MLEGEVDPGLLKEGFVLASELREEQPGSGCGFWFRRFRGLGASLPPRRYGSLAIPRGADQLEAMLVSEYARDNFAGALTYVRSMQDAKLKLMALNQMIQSLRMPF